MSQVSGDQISLYYAFECNNKTYEKLSPFLKSINEIKFLSECIFFWNLTLVEKITLKLDLSFRLFVNSNGLGNYECRYIDQMK